MNRLVLALTLNACAPVLSPTHRVEGAGTGPSAPTTITAAPHAAEADDAGTPADAACPIAMERADTVLARVGAVTITGCDLALEQVHRSRIGLPDAPPRALFDTVLRETLVASERPTEARDPAVDRALEDALLRDEALRALAHDRPDDARVERYFREHATDFTRPERVRLRRLALPSERAARHAIAALAAGTSFEELLAHSADPLAARDGGDLGWLTRDSDDAPAALVSAGFALANVGDLSERPVAVSVRTTVRRRTRVVTTWNVLELLDREPATTLTLDEVRRRIVHRLTRDRYLTLRREAAARWHEQLAQRVHDAVDPHAWAAVRFSLNR